MNFRSKLRKPKYVHLPDALDFKVNDRETRISEKPENIAYEIRRQVFRSKEGSILGDGIIHFTIKDGLDHEEKEVVAFYHSNYLWKDFTVQAYNIDEFETQADIYGVKITVKETKESIGYTPIGPFTIERGNNNLLMKMRKIGIIDPDSIKVIDSILKKWNSNATEMLSRH